MIFSRKTTVRRFIRRVIREFPGSQLSETGCVQCRHFAPIDTKQEWEVRLSVPMNAIDRFLDKWGAYVESACRFTYPAGPKKGELQDVARVVILAKGRAVRKRAASRRPDIRLPRTLEEHAKRLI